MRKQFCQIHDVIKDYGSGPGNLNVIRVHGFVRADCILLITMLIIWGGRNTLQAQAGWGFKVKGSALNVINP